ncbi:unnamed protein product [Anisakis simplex]|uniref:MI domain-containing protein n=1 Tax=Anisakis simplex TaxID=6269 RepID=A0A0M3IYK3_ANISI|nr:unnamed protein product [Anisakis simplex]
MGIGDNVLSITCKRKEARRNRKKLKKMQRIAHASHKKVEDIVVAKLSQDVVVEDKKSSKKKRTHSAQEDSNDEKSTTKKKVKKKRAKKRRREEIKRGLEEDEAQIKRFATLLGYKKRKSRNMPQVFRAEGLDYLLEVCDAKKRSEVAAEEQERSDSEVEEELLAERAVGDMNDEINLNEDSDADGDGDDAMALKDATKHSKRVSFADNLTTEYTKEEISNDESDQLNGSDSDSDDGGDVDEMMNDIDEEMNDKQIETVSGEPQVEEDIYGRLIDKKTGEIVPKDVGAKQRLAQLEAGSESVHHDERRAKLEKTMRGLVNRLNENTIVNTVKNVTELFATNPHNGSLFEFHSLLVVVFVMCVKYLVSDVKQCLFDALYKSIAVGYRLPDRIVVEYALFIALIHSTVSLELSSYFVESFILKMVDLIKAPPDDKYLENSSILLAEIYNFKVIKASMVSEILSHMREVISDKLMECSKLILSYCGSIMKSRDSEFLQKYISDVQVQLSQLPSERLLDAHVRFLVEEFLEIKQANIRKWTDAVDHSIFDHYMSIFRGLTKSLLLVVFVKIDKESELGMSVDDILHVAERGRWWLVGSAWQPAAAASSVPQTSSLYSSGTTLVDETSTKFDSSLLKLAKKAHMNTALRRTIFCQLVSSKDEMDAFEQLMRLSLKGHQERQIIHICIQCAVRESCYNPFYAAVMAQFCAFHKRFKLTAQYALWDRIRELNSLEQWQRTLLAALVADLILSRSIGVTVLKIIEFGTIDQTTTRFLRRILSIVLTRSSEANLSELFANVIASTKHKLFSQGLQLFVQMALRKPTKQFDEALLNQRITFLESLWDNERL